jgi:DNA adenine methylase
MSEQTRVKKTTAPKPFLKWVGGKGRLLEQYMPYFNEARKSEGRYFEPFFGGGAAFFALSPVAGHINDVNKALMSAYTNVKEHVGSVVKQLRVLEAEYLSGTPEERNQYFYDRREEYNNEPHETIRKTALLIFLNKTCFNGLYRENRKGQFNVPHARNANPTICDEATLRATSSALKHVNITCGSFEDAVKDAKKGDFVYFDPPYYPLNPTSSFTSYSVDDFLTDDQRKLKALYDNLTQRGVKVALSNSDAPFINDLYKDYRIVKVLAGRSINSVGSKRGKITEVLVLNW